MDWRDKRWTENSGVEASSRFEEKEFKIEVDFDNTGFDRKGRCEMPVADAGSCASVSFGFLCVESLGYVKQELKIG
jgi:hypothetical protein